MPGRWDAAGNLLSLGEGWAVAVSTDGKVIAGIGQSWTIGADGTVANEAQLDPRLDVFSANRDVSTTVGRALFPDTVGRDAFRWTRATGPVQLGHLPGHTYAEARDVSDDGRVVVGSSATHAPGGLYEAFRWTEDGGMVGLGDLPGGIDFSSATTVSADGSTVGGFGTGDSGPEYFLWTASSGMRRLSDVFRDAGVKFPGWQITAPFNQFSLGPLRMSGDGLTFAGTGINPQGQQEGWVAVIPEPAGLTLLLVATTSLLRRNQDPGRRSRKPKGTFRLSI